MKNKKYSMSFSTGGLFLPESVRIAELYSISGGWPEVSQTVIQENILQARTIASAKRRSREICSRLKLLNDQELQILLNGAPQDQAYILWLAICRRYKFVYEFAVEVLREKYLTLQKELTHEDYDSFFNAKAEWEEELEGISVSTRKKLRQVLFKILKEAGLLSPQNIIVPAILSAEIIKAIENTSRADFSVFPVAELDLKEWAK